MADDNTVVIPGSDPGTETLPVGWLEIFFGSCQDFGVWIEPQDICAPLADQMIGDHEHGLAAQPQPFAFHSGGNTAEGLSGSYCMSGKAVPAVQDACDHIFLMGTQFDGRIHAGKTQMASVIFPGADTVEALIIPFYQALPPLGLFEYPVLKSFFDQILLLLCQDGFFLINNTDFISACVQLHVIDLSLPLVQGILKETVAGGSLGSVGDGSSDRTGIGGFPFDVPFPAGGRIEDFHGIAVYGIFRSA